MRKVLIVFAALAMVLGFAMSAAADDPCLECNKCDLLNIPAESLGAEFIQLYLFRLGEGLWFLSVSLWPAP